MTTGGVDGVSERGPWPDGLCRGRHAEAAALEYEQFQGAIEAGRGSAGSVGGACLTAEPRVKLAALLSGDPGGTAGPPGDAEWAEVG